MTEENKTTSSAVAQTVPQKDKAGAVKAVVAKKKKNVRQVPRANAYIQATYNNTIITIADPNGNVLGWSSSGVVGFKGPKKATPHAAAMVTKDLMDKIADYGVKEISVFVKGIGGGREGAIRALHANGLNIVGVNDITPIPHNGCRAPKPRRV
jgi:small subunit ribosomal protein S11